ncbi:pyridoxal-dependent decarboxylase [Aspergillus karnatakaensis]|uniref:pyridoxal phosphate-dependent decarboxylase family protein n=1 Tax=Aspergillus karnatakaensis TaxID=1810916 RepID=UPI003CCDD295
MPDSPMPAYTPIPKETWDALYTLHTSLTKVLTPGLTPRPLTEVLTEAHEIFSLRASVNHPRFFSYIPSPVTPLSFLGDLLTSCYNVFSGSFEAGPAITAVELSLTKFLSEKLGLPASTAGGIFVSGGSMANLTALILARDQMLANNDRAKGVVYISTQTHFCIPKALRIIGILQSQIRLVPCDASFRMSIPALENSILQDKAAGLRPFLVVATAGTTSTGAIDPLLDISEICSRYNLWMHVDGAFGASAALSNSLAHLLEGIDRADSVAWDAHKWLFQTYGCGVVLVREKKHLRGSFADSAVFMPDTDRLENGEDENGTPNGNDVAVDLEGDEEMPNLWNYGIELTRPARHMRLWFSMQVLGLETLGNMIDRGFESAELAEECVRGVEGWEVVAPACMAILNVRYIGVGDNKGEGELDRINAGVPGKLIERNVAAISTTKFVGRVALRFCMINPLTTDEDVREFVAEMDKAARELAMDGWGQVSNGHIVA